MKKIILIPAYDPDEKLIEFLIDLRANNFDDIVIVDDGSRSACEKIFTRAEKLGRVIHHKRNCGKGQALKTGMDHILFNYSPEDIVITADADGQHKITDIISVSDNYKDSALILGCRDFDNNADIPLRSRFGNKMTSAVFYLTNKVHVKDTQTGLRCFSVSDIPFMLKVEGTRYEYEMNMLMSWAKSGREIVCTDINTVYIDGNSSSHFRPIKDSLKIYGEILKFSLSSFAGFLVDYSVYSLLFAFIGSAVLSNIFARIVSAAVNFTINFNFVFGKKTKASYAAAKYFTLAAAILAANTLLLNLLVNYAGANPYIAKIFVEIILFAASWFVQRNAVFAGKEDFPKITGHSMKAGKRI